MKNIFGGNIWRKYWEGIFGGNIGRKYCEEILRGDIWRKYQQNISGGNILRKYCEEEDGHALQLNEQKLLGGEMTPTHHIVG